MSSLDDTTANYRGTIKLSEHYLFACDPCYVGKPPDPTGVELPCDWAEFQVYTVEDAQGIRALVLTNSDRIPSELFQQQLHGDFYFYHRVGVDSGMIGFYDADHLPEIGARFPDVPDFELKEDYVFCRTYRGDGQYPLAIWSRDGEPTAIALLLDNAYFDPGWQTAQ